MRKKNYFLLSAVALLFVLITGMAYASQPISIMVDGKAISTDTPAQIINNRTMVPVKVISEALGAEVKYEAASNTVSIIRPANQPLHLVTVAGEATTWPYWQENDDLFLEYKNCIELLRTKYRSPWHTVSFNSSSGVLMIDGKTVQSNTKSYGKFTTVSLNSLKNNSIIDYTWDSKSENLTIK